MLIVSHILEVKDKSLMKWTLPDISCADSTVMSFFWTISTSAREGPLLIEILQEVQKGDTSNYSVMFAATIG